MIHIDFRAILRKTLLLLRKRHFKIFPSVCAIVLSGGLLCAQPPAGYYTSAENLSGMSLLNELHNIIKQHSTVNYNDLWQKFYTTDVRPDNGKVWDIYSDRPGQGAAYYFTFGSDQCGNYSSEGDCYNREHSVPKSWFGDTKPMNTDLFHLYPTDGFVNSKRGNLPLGKVTSANWTSTNGSKMGNNSYPGYVGLAFEPVDSFKGDLARTYLYMAVCYKNKDLGLESQSMFSGGSLKPWARKMLLEWCALDPVSKKEIDRNNAVYNIQHNRNPFIDYPELAEMVFGSDTNVAFVTSVLDYEMDFSCRIYPNPAVNEVFVEMDDFTIEGRRQMSVLDVTGKCIIPETNVQVGPNRIDFSSMARGIYFLKITDSRSTKMYKILKQ